MKTPEEIFNKNWRLNPQYSDDREMAITKFFAIEAMKDYADQFKPVWVPASKFPLEDGLYLQAIRYGIRLYPDTVCITDHGFYSVSERKIIDDVAYLMRFQPHPLDDGSGQVINLLRPTEKLGNKQ